MPESHYKELEEDWQKYQKGEIEAISWEELRRHYNNYLQHKGKSISWEEVKQNLRD